MRVCPKCKKEYDDTWKVCLSCNENLIVSNLTNANTASDYKDIKSEINLVRNEITNLNERINRTEYVLEEREANSRAKRLENIYKPSSVEETKEEPKESFFRRLISTKQPLFTTKKSIEPKREKEPEPVIPVKREPVLQNEDTKNQLDNFEQTVGGKWFNKLGIFAVVIGVALLIGYSFQYMGPVGKIAIGFAFGAGMLLFGHYIEKKENFSVYGKGLIAGGWAIVYFTTFAMHHIPQVRLVASSFMGMFLLLCVSAATVADIYRYRSQVATAFSYLLIFITLMITPVSAYTMVAAIPVALSLVFFMRKMDWLEFGLYGIIMTYLTYMGWFKIAESAHATMTLEQFVVAAEFLAIYWAIFVLATLLIKQDENKTIFITEDIRFGMKDLAHILNTAIASYIGWTIVHSGFDKYVLHFLALGGGLYLGLTVLTYILKERSLYIISSTVSIIFTAIYLATKFSGYQLTVSYIIVAQLVLLAGILLKEYYWRILAFVWLLAVAFKLFTIDSFVVKNVVLGSHLSTRTLLFAFAFIMYLANHILYARLKKAKLLIQAEENYDVIISYMYPIIYAMGTWLDLPKVLTAPCWIILSVVLLHLGVIKNNLHQRIQGYILGIGAFLRLLMSNMLIQGGISIFSYRILTSIPVFLLLTYSSILIQDEKTRGILKSGEKKMIYLYPYMIFTILMFIVWFEAPKNLVAPIWACNAVGYSLRAIYSKESYYLSISSIAAISAGARAFFANLLQGQYLVGAEGNILYPIITAVVLYMGNTCYIVAKPSMKEIEGSGDTMVRMFLHSSRLVYSLMATALITTVLIIKLHGAVLTVSLGMEGLVLLVLGFWLRERNWRVLGLFILLLTLGKAFLIDLRKLSTIYYILSLIALGIALLFVSFIYTKHRDAIKRLI